MAQRKFRRCSECGVVRPTTDFKPVMSKHGTSGQQVRCPACGHVGLRWSFGEVPPPKGEEAASQPSRRTYRRCPACGAVLPALEFLRVTARGFAGGFGEKRWVRCPACGHENLQSSLVEVEPPAEGEGGS